MLHEKPSPFKELFYKVAYECECPRFRGPHYDGGEHHKWKETECNGQVQGNLCTCFIKAMRISYDEGLNLRQRGERTT